MKQKLKYLIICGLLAYLLGSLRSCYTQRSALRDLNKIKVHHPELIEEVTDTIIQVWEVEKEVFIPGDTLEGEWEWDWSKVDTFYQTINDSTVVTEIQLIRDTVVKVSVRTEVFPDTFEVVLRDTIETIVIKTEYVTKIDNKIPLGYRILMGILALGILLLIIFLLRRKKSSE